MRLLYGTSASNIKIWQSWQFQRSHGTYFVHYDGNKLIYHSESGLAITNWQDIEDMEFVRRLVRFVFEANEIEDRTGFNQ